MFVRSNDGQRKYARKVRVRTPEQNDHEFQTNFGKLFSFRFFCVKLADEKQIGCDIPLEAYLILFSSKFTPDQKRALDENKAEWRVRVFDSAEQCQQWERVNLLACLHYKISVERQAHENPAVIVVYHWCGHGVLPGSANAP